MNVGAAATLGEGEALARRIRWLRWRTIGVGITGALAALAGLLMLSSVLGDVYRELFRGSGAVRLAFHLPPALQPERMNLLPWLCLGLAVVGTWGMSTGRIRRRYCLVAYALMAMTAAADILFAPPLRQPIFHLPSGIERMFNDGRYTEVERLVDNFPQQAAAVNYVKAQIGLRTGDRRMVEKHGAPLLTMVDTFVYRVHDDPAEQTVLAEQVGAFRADVIHAIDRTLHGVPVTQVGLTVERQSAGRLGIWVHVAVFGLAGAIALLAGVALTWVWRRMRANLLHIDDLQHA